MARRPHRSFVPDSSLLLTILFRDSFMTSRIHMGTGRILELPFNILKGYG